METEPNGKKIFISHSSKDSGIVDIFVDKILHLGLNIAPKDIAYTSREETGVTNGDSIPKYIKENISNCDFVFFMISENYRKSEICLNEMGAAWATDSNVKIMILPEVGFDSIGWLYNIHKGARISDTNALDAIFDDFNEKYGSQKLSAWNRNKAEFIELIEARTSANLPAIIEPDNTDNEDDLGLLDYRIRFDENIALHIETMELITTATTEYSEALNKRTAQLTSLNANPHLNIKQIRGVIMAVANDMNKMSNTIDVQEPKIREYFAKIVENGVKMHNAGENDPIATEENRQAVQEFVNAIIETKNATVEGRRALTEIQNLEQSQNKAKKRLVSCYDTLINAFDYCISQSNELIKL